MIRLQEQHRSTKRPQAVALVCVKEGVRSVRGLQAMLELANVKT
jgi:hypothetical protein